MATWNDVTFTEHIPNTGPGVSPTFNLTNTEGRVTRTYDVAWDNLWDFVHAFLGYPQIATGGPNNKNYIERITPHYIAQTNSEGKSYLYATQILNIQGVGGPLDGQWKTPDPAGGIARYNKARCTVLYEYVTYEILNDDQVDKDPTDQVPYESTLERYVTIRPNPGALYLTLPQGQFKYVGGAQPNTPVNFGPGQIVPDYDVSLTWHQVPKKAVPLTLINSTLVNPAIDTSLGTVNCKQFMGYAAGFVLFISCQISDPKRSSLGDRVYDVEFRFKIAKNAHNTLPGLQAAGQWAWLEVSIDGLAHPETGTPLSKVHIYDSTDLN